MKDIMAGVDLHSNNLMLALVDRNGQRLFHKKLACELPRIEQALLPYRARIDTIAVESTFNWYWLVDGLQELGYRTVLANPAAVQQYEGIKHTDDKHDAFWLAEMLRLNILPNRLHLRADAAAGPGSVAAAPGPGAQADGGDSEFEESARAHARFGFALGEIKRMEVDDVWRLFQHPADQLLAREELRVIRELDASIERLEE